VNEFLRGRAVIERAFVSLFEDHHATALDARIVRCNRRRGEIGKGDVGDEPAPFLYLQPWLFALAPFHDAHFATQHAGIDADIWNGLSQHKCTAPRLAILSRLGRSR
jgi:hypothetical protein